MTRRGVEMIWFAAFMTLFLGSLRAQAQQIPLVQPGSENSIEVYGVITAVAELGDFEDMGDGTYLLTIEGVDSSAPYWMYDPMFMPLPPELIGATPVSDESSVGTMLMPSMINAWRLDEGLSAEAWLVTRTTSVYMLLSQPDFLPAENAIEFIVEIISIIGGDDAKGFAVPPATFRQAVLSITLDEELLFGLDIGIANAIESVRWTCSGTARQLAICECKREVDRNNGNRDGRVEGYRECNALEVEEKR